MSNKDTITNNLLTYANVLDSRKSFIQSGGRYSDEFNLFDTPGVKYFKLFFYFNNGESDTIGGSTEKSTGLLAPTWELPNIGDDNYYQYNSAWSYLKMNCEDERADQLKYFVNLLSNISMKSPWYFSEISGLDAAMERKQPMDANFKIEEERKKISIKCLPDAYDNRIGSLLDLYRSIVWSWYMKREVLPSNLRKFDMGVFIFNDPVANFNVRKMNANNSESNVAGRMYKKSSRDDFDLNTREIKNNHKINYKTSEIGGKSSNAYQSSYKYIEFHNCEIDYNSSKSTWSTVSNIEGLTPQYTIDILFDDCYEYNYNEFNMQKFGDLIVWDLFSRNYSYKSRKNTRAYQSYVDLYDTKTGVNYEWLSNATGKTEPLNEYQGPQNNEQLHNIFGGTNKGTQLTGAAAQIVGVAEDALSGLLKKAVLGNLYTFSLTKIRDQIQGLAKGDVWSTARAITEYVKDGQQRNDNNLPVHHSLFEQTTVEHKYLGQAEQNLFPKRKITPIVKKMGNMHRANTLANNI